MRRMGRRPPAARAVLLSAVLLVGAGPVASCSVPDRPDPGPPVPFSDVTATRRGGEAGRGDWLLVRTDGLAVRVAEDTRAGQLASDDLARLRQLLESEQFRVETALAEGEDELLCTDQITVRITMGPLSMSRTGPCRSEDEAPTPTFAEITSILSPALDGSFAGPVPDGPPRLQSARLEATRFGRPGEVIRVDGNGRLSRTRGGQVAVRRTLRRPDRDALRLLFARLAELPAPSCPPEGTVRLILHTTPPTSIPGCQPNVEQPEMRGVVDLLAAASR